MKLSKASFWRIGILFAFVAIVGSLSVSRPTALSDNGFLKAMMGPDLISVLVVMLTITFASVANVHLSITRMVALAKNRQAAAAAAGRARAQLNSNAWTIFWAFGFALAALFVYGEFPQEPLVQAMMIAVCMTVVLLNGLVMHDIYRSIFILVANEPHSEASSGRADYSQDSPRAGHD